jgi:hypothetical protein
MGTKIFHVGCTAQIMMEDIIELITLISTTINTAFLVVIYHRQKWGKF